MGYCVFSRAHTAAAIHSMITAQMLSLGLVAIEVFQPVFTAPTRCTLQLRQPRYKIATYDR
jgi:hypothetical protein